MSLNFPYYFQCFIISNKCIIFIEFPFTNMNLFSFYRPKITFPFIIPIPKEITDSTCYINIRKTIS